MSEATKLPEFIGNVIQRSFSVETNDGLTADVIVTVDLQTVAHTIGGKAMRNRIGIARALQGAIRLNAVNVKRKPQ